MNIGLGMLAKCVALLPKDRRDLLQVAIAAVEASKGGKVLKRGLQRRNTCLRATFAEGTNVIDDAMLRKSGAWVSAKELVSQLA